MVLQRNKQDDGEWGWFLFFFLSICSKQHAASIYRTQFSLDAAQKTTVLVNVSEWTYYGGNDNIYSSYGGCKLLKHKDNMLSRLHRGPRWGDWLLWRCWCWHRTHVRWQRKWECVDVCVVIYTTMQIFGIVFHLSWKVILLLMTWNVTRKINIKNFIRFFLQKSHFIFCSAYTLIISAAPLSQGSHHSRQRHMFDLAKFYFVLLAHVLIQRLFCMNWLGIGAIFIQSPEFSDGMSVSREGEASGIVISRQIKQVNVVARQTLKNSQVFPKLLIWYISKKKESTANEREATRKKKG